jgi:hypothetical protein
MTYLYVLDCSCGQMFQYDKTFKKGAQAEDFEAFLSKFHKLSEISWMASEIELEITYRNSKGQDL